MDAFDQVGEVGAYLIAEQLFTPPAAVLEQPWSQFLEIWGEIQEMLQCRCETHKTLASFWKSVVLLGVPSLQCNLPQIIAHAFEDGLSLP